MDQSSETKGLTTPDTTQQQTQEHVVINREGARFKILNHKWGWNKDTISQRIIPNLYRHLEHLDAKQGDAKQGDKQGKRLLV